jgi:hypothetical protein
VLADARRRYHAARLVERPCLTDPTSYVGLFPRHDLVALARVGLWPLPPRALRYIRTSPAERARRQIRQARDLAPAILDRLGPDIADIAIAVAQEVVRAQ